jgi:5-methylcytosine-specific restriction endonuclease McrA
MVRTVERILIRMPLPRLQELPSGRDEFLYKITWTLRDVTEPGSGLGRAVAAYQRAAPGPFDNRILMGPGVVVALARFQGLVRELVTARWVRKVRDLNGEQLRERDLHDHLFGFRREALAALAEPLLALHDRRCFYCGRNLQVAQVDHFLPWARYPDNRLLNLVPADADCNSSKLAHLAAIEHLDRWLMRFTDRRLRQGLATLATAKAWPEGGKETLAVSRALYGQQPEGGRLWFGRGEFRRFAKGAVAARIEAALAAGEP